MMQETRWGMTPAACWDVIKAVQQPRPGYPKERLLPDAVWELYRLEKSAVMRQCWLEVAVWSTLPECLSGLWFEVELWRNYGVIVFAFHRKKWDGLQMGCCMLRWPSFVHQFEREFWHSVLRDWKIIFPHTYAMIQRIEDPSLWEAKQLQITRACEAGAEEWKRLYKEFYQGWKLFLWIYQPLYRSSAAKGLSIAVGLNHQGPTGDVDDYFIRLFTKDVVLGTIGSFGLEQVTCVATGI